MILFVNNNAGILFILGKWAGEIVRISSFIARMLNISSRI